MNEKCKGKTIIGFSEKVKIIGPKESKTVTARIDTGATMSSIDSRLAAKLKLGPVIRTKLVKSAQGSSSRPVIKAKLKLDGKVIEEDFSIADRKHMKYSILIGQNILKKEDFLIDPHKKVNK
ncbi:hypothetical protein GF361_00445 [Candidatus Woesearchaeota archaeon]|nr:hypothetical protein [Candidatus Woesearchaeota archaeon]